MMIDQKYQEEFAQNYEELMKFRASYDTDEALRQRIDSGDGGPLLEAVGLNLPDGVDARVVPAQEDVHYVIMPPDPSFMLRDQELEQVSGGSTVGTGGSAATGSSFLCSTIPSSLGTLSSAGTAGSAEV